MSDQQTLTAAPWPDDLVAIVASSWWQAKCSGCKEPVTWGREAVSGKWFLFEADPPKEPRLHPGLGVRIDLVHRQRIHFGRCPKQSEIQRRGAA